MEHYYGSRNWVDPTERGETFLGEDDATPQIRVSGIGPRPFPLVVALGKALCFQQGDAGDPDNLPERVFREGFPVQCWVPPNDAFVRKLFLLDPLDRGDQITMATVSNLLYTDPPLAGALLGNALGPGSTTIIVPDNASAIPGSIIAEGPDQVAIAISGTTTPEQRALQILYAGYGIVNFAFYGTSAFWMAARSAVQERVWAAGITPAKPIILFGHSYGGVVSTLLAADYRRTNPGLDVRLLTFGMPRPGDIRLKRALARVRRQHIANTGDMVCGLPPTVNELVPLVFAFPEAFLEQWGVFWPAGEQLLLRADGTTLATDESTLTWSAMIETLTRAVAGLDPPPFAEHAIAEYLARLLL